MDADITIRPARTDESDTVAALLVDSYAEFAARMSPDAWASFAQEIGNVRGRVIESEIVVAERHGQLLGSVTLFSGDRGVQAGTLGVRLLAVHPTERNAGIGRALIAYAIDRAHEQGKHRIVLAIAPEMESARDLTEKVGFLREPALDHEPAPGVRYEGYAYKLE